MQAVEINLSEVLEKFFEYCAKVKLWKVYQDQGLIQTKSGFHKFIRLENPQLHCFDEVMKHPTTLIKDGTCYRQVRYDFVALISYEHVSAHILLSLKGNSKLADFIALYDLADAMERSFNFNQTKSEVFQEFEKYLAEKYQLSLRAFQLSESVESQLPAINSDYLYPVQTSVEAPVRKDPRRAFLNFQDSVNLSKEVHLSPFFDSQAYCSPNGSSYGSIAVFSSRIRPLIT